MSSDLDLPGRQRELHAMFRAHRTVAVERLHEMYFGAPAPDRRVAQTRMGPAISRLNKRLKRIGKRVSPTLTKGVYRLTTI